MADNDEEEGESNHYVKKLDSPVTAGAENFSQGERQLVRRRILNILTIANAINSA